MKALTSVALQTSSDSKSHPKDQLGRHTHAEGEPGCRCDRWGHPCPHCLKPRTRSSLSRSGLAVSREGGEE